MITEASNAGSPVREFCTPGSMAGLVGNCQSYATFVTASRTRTMYTRISQRKNTINLKYKDISGNLPGHGNFDGNILKGIFAFLYFSILCLISNPSPAHASADVLEPQFVKSKSFAQVYTLTALFNDSSLIQIQFILTNLGIADRNGACKIIFLSGANRPVIWNKKYSKAEWNYASNPDEHALRIGPNEIAVKNGTTKVIAGDDKMQAEVLFESMPDIVVPPDAEITAKDRFFSYTIPIRWMPAQVKLKRKDIAPQKLNAFAMLESSRSTSFPSDICRGWLTFRGYDANSSFNANIRLPPVEKTPAAGWIWKSPDQKPVPIRGIQLEIDAQRRNNKMPLLRQVSAPDDSFTITAREPLCRYSFIDELGPVFGTIVKLVIGEPAVYFYRAEVKFSNSDASIPGILEYIRIE